MNTALAHQLDVFAENIVEKAVTDHDREMAQRAHVYAWRRIEDGSVTTFEAAKSVFAAFGDGFCTGVHGDGKNCPHA